MKKLFDTAVQKLKYKVLREVARLAFEDQLDSGALLDIPAKIMPGPKPTMRCCIYKERAIIGERIKLAMGGNKKNPNVVEVLDIACDECPVEGMRCLRSLPRLHLPPVRGRLPEGRDQHCEPPLRDRPIQMCGMRKVPQRLPL